MKYLFYLLIAVLMTGCDGSDNTYTERKTCIVKEIADGIVTIECDGILYNVDDDRYYYVGQPVAASMEYVLDYVEIHD